MTKITVDKALLESVLEAHIKVLDTLRDWTNSDDFLWIQYSDKTMQNEALTLREALAEPAVGPVTKITLKDGKYLKLEPLYSYGPTGWVLYTESNKPVRDLDVYESGFVNAALKASPPPPAEVPLLTDAEIDDLWAKFISGRGGQTFSRAIEQAVRQKAGLV